MLPATKLSFANARSSFFPLAILVTNLVTNRGTCCGTWLCSIESVDFVAALIKLPDPMIFQPAYSFLFLETVYYIIPPPIMWLSVAVTPLCSRRWEPLTNSRVRRQWDRDWREPCDQSQGDLIVCIMQQWLDMPSLPCHGHKIDTMMPLGVRALLYRMYSTVQYSTSLYSTQYGTLQ